MLSQVLNVSELERLAKKEKVLYASNSHTKKGCSVFFYIYIIGLYSPLQYLIEERYENHTVFHSFADPSLAVEKYNSITS